MLDCPATSSYNRHMLNSALPPDAFAVGLFFLLFIAGWFSSKKKSPPKPSRLKALTDMPELDAYEQPSAFRSVTKREEPVVQVLPSALGDSMDLQSFIGGMMNLPVSIPRTEGAISSIIATKVQRWRLGGYTDLAEQVEKHTAVIARTVANAGNIQKGYIELKHLLIDMEYDPKIYEEEKKTALAEATTRRQAAESPRIDPPSPEATPATPSPDDIVMGEKTRAKDWKP